MLMFLFRAAITAKCIAARTTIVEYFVQDVLCFQRTKDAVEGDAVEVGRQGFFDIRLAKGHFSVTENMEHVSPLAGYTQARSL